MLNETSIVDSIPAEIWSRIIFLHLKSHVDYRLEHLFTYTKDAVELRREYRLRKEQVDNLKLVCQKWRVAVTPFCYEYVVLNNELTSSWNSLSSTLLINVLDKPPSDYVKQLHFFAEDGHLQRTSSVLYLLNITPMVEVLSIGLNFNNFDVFNNFIDSVSEHVKTLRRLNWLSPLGSTTKSIESVLLRAKNLQWLTISTESVYQFQGGPRIYLALLRTLVIHSREDNDSDVTPLLRWRLPHLSRLRMTYIARPPNNDALFFSNFGANLQELDFTYAVRDCQPLLNLCPSLSILVFGVQTNPLELIRHNSIRIVRVKGLRIRGVAHDLVAARLHDHLIRLTVPNNLPSLTQIQLLDFVPQTFDITVYSAHIQQRWRHWIWALRILNISLVDFYGVLIDL